MDSYLDVIAFDSSSAFLQTVFAQKKAHNSLFSLRAWSQHLGFSNPMILSRYLRGKMKLSSKVAHQLSEKLNFNSLQKEYFKILIRYENLNDVEVKKSLYEQLLSIRNEYYSEQLGADQFAMISEWYHLAIIELTRLKDFKCDSYWISQCLGVPQEQVRSAIDRLIRLRLLEFCPQNGIKRVTKGTIKAGDGDKDQAIRRYHKQILEYAIRANEEQDIQEKSFTASVLPLEVGQVVELKKIIREFHCRVEALVKNNGPKGNAEELYQFNVQFFRLTRKNENRKC